MNALVLTLFVSALLFVYGLVQFAVAWARRDHQHADRLALLPLENDVDDVSSVAAISIASASTTTKDNRHAR